MNKESMLLHLSFSTRTIDAPSNAHSPCERPTQAVPPAPALSLSSIFLRAANIISSLRRCSSCCLSFLFCDHAGFLPEFAPVLVPAPASTGEGSIGADDPTFEERLYRVIRSGCEGFGLTAAAPGRAPVDVDDRGGSCGWKEGGG